MVDRKKCPNCGKPILLRKTDWGLIFINHNYVIAGQRLECPGSGKLVK
jgi:ssDNA-binding Zn-finger/Zn-ribbon topoisomerase 1